MEDFVLKCAEFGVLGVIVLLLLTRGLATLNELSKTTATLAESINKLADKVAHMDTRISNFGYQLECIDRHIDKLEEHSARNFNELRDLIKGKHGRGGD